MTSGSNQQGSIGKWACRALIGATIFCAMLCCVSAMHKGQTAHERDAGQTAAQNLTGSCDQKAAFERLENRMSEILSTPVLASWTVPIAVESGDEPFVYEATLKARRAFAQSVEQLKALPRDDTFDDALNRMIYGRGGLIERYIEHARLRESSYADAQNWLESGKRGRLREESLEKAAEKQKEAEAAWVRAKNQVSGHSCARN